MNSLDLICGWAWAGELDAPVGADVVDEVRRRSDRSLRHILDDIGPGTTVLVASLARPAAHDPAAIDLGRSGAIDDLRALLDGPTPATIVLDRADLLRGDVGWPVDGLALRNILERLRERHPTVTVVVYLSPFSYAWRHALPGTLLLSVREAPATRESSDLDDDTVEAIERLRRGDATRAAIALARAAGRPEADVGCPPDELVAAIDSSACGELSLVLNRALRAMWPIDGDVTEIRSFDSRTLEPSAAAAIYRLCSLTAPVGPRTTCDGVDLGRWLCAQRSHRYESAAAVTASLHDEVLANRNLAHLPSLEHADLRRVDLSNSDVYRVDCSSADLSGSRAHRADLARGQFKGANLTNADLSGADLTYACLEQADLTGAIVATADLHRAITEHARGLASAPRIEAE